MDVGLLRRALSWRASTVLPECFQLVLASLTEIRSLAERPQASAINREYCRVIEATAESIAAAQFLTPIHIFLAG